MVRAGIALLYIFTFVGFILFAIAIAVAYSGPKAVGVVGVTLFAVTVSGLVIFGVSTKGPAPSPSLLEEENITAGEHHHDKKKIKDIGLPKIIITLLIFLIQLICLFLLLGFGGNAVVTGQLGEECKGVQDEMYNGGNPMPVEVMNTPGYVTVTRDYTATVTTTTTSLGTVTEMMTESASVVSGFSSTTTSGEDGVATVVTWTSITVTATVTAGL